MTGHGIFLRQRRLRTVFINIHQYYFMDIRTTTVKKEAAYEYREKEEGEVPRKPGEIPPIAIASATWRP